jgi:hypothetical protein
MNRLTRDSSQISDYTCTKYVCILLQFEALAKQRRPINTLGVKEIFYYRCSLKSKET